MKEAGRLQVWTVGHSGRTLAEFLDVLGSCGIEAVADVRRFPGSRAHPQFQRDALQAGLRAGGIDYLPLPALGGRRRPASDAEGSAWRNEAFRGYADHLGTEEFAGGLFDLLMVARGIRTAVMCAEAVWWRCHRRMIADVLVSLGADVVHIMGVKATQAHRLAAPARMARGILTYAPARR